MLRPVAADAVYVTQPGFVRSATIKDRVVAGETLATLENLELQAEIVRCRRRLEAAELQLQLLQRRQSGQTAATLDLPTAQKAVEDARRQLEARRGDEARLTIVAPRDGDFLPPAVKPNRHDPRALPVWSRRPLEQENLGAYLEAGTIVGYVGDATRLEAVAEADENDVQAVEIGAEATLMIDVAGGRTVGGRVIEVGVDDGVDEAALPSAPVSRERPGERPAKFRVLIAVEERIDGVTLEAPVVGVVVAPSECLAAKLRRYLSQAFRGN
ncbi:MAG: hypothetical protein QM775_10650 [Pirellulales bacterium]